MVARTALKTPTAVAAFLIEHNGVFESLLDDLQQELTELCTARLQGERRRLTDRAYALNTVSTAIVRGAERKLGELRANLRLRASLLLQRRRSRLDSLTLSELSKTYLDRHAQRLTQYELKLEARNPERILSLGYALVYDGDGRIVKSVSGLMSGDDLSVRLQDGTVKTEIKKIIKK